MPTPTFSQIKTDLTSALNEWDRISEQAPTVSKDEEKLKDMQKLLRELQAKMKELNLD